ncbi:hypothetical protein MUP77_05895 [Candidatus Bathyarchaeota archaeon]|nr:hypothetical protein [Candidatus Bathyarchaeota archaeon]
METWATVVIVLGTNLITNLLTWFLTNRQLTHSNKQLEMQLKSQREVEQHKKKWEVRSRPLLELREKLATMTEKLEKIVNSATQVEVVDGVPMQSDPNLKDVRKALEDWSAYFESGEFYRVEHMQYEYELKIETHRILRDYQEAYFGVFAFWRGESTDKEIRKAESAIKRNARRVSTLQSKINELLEEL